MGLRVIHFPILNRVDIQNFELYPGTGDDAGLQADFEPGITLVLGANGLGKSTLVLLLYRMLTGSAEIRGQRPDELGSGQIEFRNLYRHELRTFADRVQDAAVDAEATLHFSLGATSIEVTRDLSSLTLTSMLIDGEAVEAGEEAFRECVVDASGVDNFLNWLLVLRYLVFYFDDRRSLVWDPTAQRRMLPLLFLPATDTGPIEDLASQILSNDSTARNLGAALTKQERELEKQERAMSSQPLVRTELASLIEARQSADSELESLQQIVSEAESGRSKARLRALQTGDEHLSASAELERLRLNEIRHAFPSSSESAAYLMTHLFTESTCLVCGNDAAEMTEALRARLEAGNCIVCDSPTRADRSPQVSRDKIREVRSRVEESNAAYHAAIAERHTTESEYMGILTKIATLDQTVTEKNAQITRLERSLPESDRSISKRREAIAQLRTQNAVLKEQVLVDKGRLAGMVDEQNRRLTDHKESIRDAFETHAKDFLVETIALVWGSHTEQIGQLGKGISFSVFQVDMTRGGSETATRRETAAQVSESQQEFIDLAFRMALIRVAGDGGSGTLVMDAPESSLDAVFAPRAANVLSKFGLGDSHSRVVITSNLVDGQLIPQIAARAGISSVNDPRVVNLFEIAAPTAATRQLHEEYSRALERAFTAPGAT